MADSFERPAWYVVGIVIAAFLAVLWKAILAGLGKFVLFLLMREKAALKVALDECYMEELATLDGLVGDMLKVQADLGAIRELARAVEQLAEAQADGNEKMGELVLEFARMGEREKMREKWDGIDRRHGERREA